LGYRWVITTWGGEKLFYRTKTEALVDMGRRPRGMSLEQALELRLKIWKERNPYHSWYPGGPFRQLRNQNVGE
jgi:hypothetical protein